MADVTLCRKTTSEPLTLHGTEPLVIYTLTFQTLHPSIFQRTNLQTNKQTKDKSSEQNPFISYDTHTHTHVLTTTTFIFSSCFLLPSSFHEAKMKGQEGKESKKRRGRGKGRRDGVCGQKRVP